ncbi:hypothetical protein HJG60_008033 [Phyllostomus discolor]|uniref:Uncharacterized protein n=1 Tax=Phyllostomus discolor TaxID=89673 RepID=A0A834EYG3_9CHIR|nr:hypothetical protein HJG60_008033 [Phyllostomus discolor]
MDACPHGNNNVFIDSDHIIITSGPDWYGSVGWLSSCKPKCHQFTSQLWHIPGWQARSPVGGTCKRQPISVPPSHQCFSPALSPSLSPVFPDYMATQVQCLEMTHAWLSLLIIRLPHSPHAHTYTHTWHMCSDMKHECTYMLTLCVHVLMEEPPHTHDHRTSTPVVTVCVCAPAGR